MKNNDLFRFCPSDYLWEVSWEQSYVNNMEQKNQNTTVESKLFQFYFLFHQCEKGLIFLMQMKQLMPHVVCYNII